MDDCFIENTINKWLHSANFLILTVALLACLAINFLPFSLGKQAPSELGSHDFTMDLYGWNSFKNEFEQLRNKDIQTHAMKPGSVIISNKWFPAAHLDYYVAYPLQMKLYAFGPLFDIHNFAWLNKQNGDIQKGSDAYYISPSNYSSIPDSSITKAFSIIEPPAIIHQYKSKKNVRNFYIYRMKKYQSKLR